MTRSNPVYVSCTYCWGRHVAYPADGKVFITGYCGHDPRRYFLDSAEYHAYVDRYRKEGGKHIDKWDQPEQEPLPLEVMDGR